MKSCTGGGCNNLQIGGECPGLFGRGRCTAGARAGIKIRCSSKFPVYPEFLVSEMKWQFNPIGIDCITLFANIFVTPSLILMKCFSHSWRKTKEKDKKSETDW